MVGSVIQLPGVGGGSQLATIAALEHIFDVPKELAASCGIMLWLVTFVAVIPAGLLLAHRERFPCGSCPKESHEKEAQRRSLRFAARECERARLTVHGLRRHTIATASADDVEPDVAILDYAPVTMQSKLHPMRHEVPFLRL